MLALLRVPRLEPSIVRLAIADAGRDAHATPSGRRTRMRRLVRCAALAAALVGAAGCDRGSPQATVRDAFTSFETRCERIPAAAPEVVAIPLAVAEDDSRTVAELTRLHGGAPSSHRTMGLTLTRLGHEATIDFNGVTDPARGRTCFRTQMRVELFMRPFPVYVAREATDDPCARAVIHEHEMKHVAVYDAYLQEAADRLAQALPAAFANEVLYTGDEARTRDAVEARIRQFLADHLQQSSRELELRQRSVDSPEEYARIAAACRGQP
jgi:hypothetical protein